MTRLLLIAGAACALAPAARADSLEAVGAGYDGNVVELRHEVDAQLGDRGVVFHVERELVNTSTSIVRGELTIDLPTRAVVRGFRVRSGDRWIDGALLPAEKADDEFERLTTTGAQLEHGPAEMEWIGDGEVRVRAYPFAPGARIAIGYTVEAPVCYTHGRWIADYVDIVGGDLAPVLLHAHGARVFTSAQLAAELGASVDEACGDDVTITGDDAHRYLVADAQVAAPAAVRFARAHAGADDVVRVSIDVGTEIAPAPRGARVVFVVDASRSVRDHGVAAQLAWVRGYLAHVPDATFEIVLYRRFAERVFGRFEPAARAAARIDAIDPARLVPGNGSHLDRGLELAATLLAGRGGPRRVVAFTDERWRPGWSPSDAGAALRALPADAVIHFAGLTGGDPAAPPSIDRDDDDVLAATAARWGGIAVTVGGGALAPRDAFAAAALVLVRPLRIDHAVLHRSLDASVVDDLGDLAEGAGVYRAWLDKDHAPVAVDGMIWGRPWRRELVPDADAARRWAALAIGDPVRAQLDDAAILALATTGAVVSPMTSFLAVDSRWGPAALPQDWGEGAICGCDSVGTIGGGSFTTTTTCGIGVGSTIEAPAPSLLAAMLAPRAEACAAQAGVRRWDLAAGIDTTGDEIVEVEVRGTDDAAFRTCIEDAVWELALDDRFARFTRRYDVPLRGAR